MELDSLYMTSYKGLVAREDRRGASDITRAIDFPGLVRGVRKARRLTQQQLAQELGVTFSTVNCWENGKHRPIPSLAMRLVEIARAAGVGTAHTGRSSAGVVRKTRKTR